MQRQDNDESDFQSQSISKTASISEEESEEDSLNERIEELMYDKKKPPKNKLLEDENENEDLEVVSQHSNYEITHEN